MIPKMLEMLTIRAESLLLSRGRKARVIRTTPQKFISISQSKSSSATCSKVPPIATPALLKSRSARPWAARTAVGKGGDRLAVGDVEPVAADLDSVRLGQRGGLGQARPR